MHGIFYLAKLSRHSQTAGCPAVSGVAEPMTSEAFPYVPENSSSSGIWRILTPGQLAIPKPPATKSAHKTKKMPIQADLPSIAQRRAAFIQQGRAQNQASLGMLQPPVSYVSEWNRFTAWVTLQPVLDSSNFITRENVDAYFSRVIASRAGAAGTIRVSVSAIQWYQRNRAPYNATPFKVENAVVLEALRTQKAPRISAGNPGSDPSTGLKDIIPTSDMVKVMDVLYKGDREDWANAAFNFSWGWNQGVRGASNRKLCLKDLNLSHGFGPEEEGDLSRALLLVLRPGDVHKDRHDTARQVCSWRHKNWKLCSVLATACAVISTLRDLGPSLNFKKPSKNQPAKWWDIPVIDWEDYNGKYLANTDTYCIH